MLIKFVYLREAKMAAELQLESNICGLGLDGLVELAGHLQVDAKEFRKLALSKKIREKIERDLDEAEDKKTLLVGLVAFVNGKPPPLKNEASAGKQQVTVKNELPDQSVKATEEALEKKRR